MMKEINLSYYDTTEYMRGHYGHDLLSCVDPNYEVTRPWIGNDIGWQFDLIFAANRLQSRYSWCWMREARGQGVATYSFAEADDFLAPQQRIEALADILSGIALRLLNNPVGEEL